MKSKVLWFKGILNAEFAENMLEAHTKNFYKPKDFSYFACSKKYKNHFNLLTSDKNNLHFTFLTGNAGVGKSTILKYEFINPILHQKSRQIIFSFRPNDGSHNQDFFKSVLLQLLNLEEIGADLQATMLKLKELPLSDVVSDMVLSLLSVNSVRVSHPISEVQACFAILQEFSCKERVYLTIEDIHLAEEIFRVFLSEIAKLSNVDIKIIATTRLSRRQHNFEVFAPQKWINIENLDGKDAAAFIRHVDSPGDMNNISLHVTEGNPFCLKEIIRLRKQQRTIDYKRNGLGDFANLSNFSLRSSEFIFSVLEQRFLYLDIQSQNLLKICIALGFSFSEKRLSDLYEHTHGVSPEFELGKVIELGFLKHERDKEWLSFDHHITYSFFEEYFERDEQKKLHKSFFSYYRRHKNNTLFKSELAFHAHGADLKSYACFYYKIIADSNFSKAQYGAAAYHYEQYLTLLADSSKPEKFLERLLHVYKNLQKSYLILWEQKKADDIARRLLMLSDQLTGVEQLEVHSLITTTYWTSGDFKRAYDFSLETLKKAKALNYRDGIVSANVRCGSLKAEMGMFEEALEYHEDALNFIDEAERLDKFGLFVSVYPNITSVQSIACAELYMSDRSEDLINVSLAYLDKNIDDFSKLFVITHAGYSLYLAGNFCKAIPYLNEGCKMNASMKAGLLSTTCEAMLGICQIYNGDSDGMELLRSAEARARETRQIHKRGMIDLFYLEGLLLQFETEEFERIINEKIDFAHEAKQFSFLAWMYFLKAVYYSIYKKSIQGYVGAIAKANMIAGGLGMKTLQLNISSLAKFHHADMFSLNEEDVDAHQTFFDKADFFNKLLSNVTPIRPN